MERVRPKLDKLRENGFRLHPIHCEMIPRDARELPSDLQQKLAKVWQGIRFLKPESDGRDWTPPETMASNAAAEPGRV
ncbi:MAG: hypothetical protein HY820_14320 [Acidobacteria bacterium]|nr:hypothetical protein [Acidobacteriota bacterium]